jgi:hypothetical protein
MSYIITNENKITGVDIGVNVLATRLANKTCARINKTDVIIKMIEINFISFSCDFKLKMMINKNGPKLYQRPIIQLTTLGTLPKCPNK